MNIKDNIINYAKEIGIECIGFTNTVFSKEFISKLKIRREKGLLSGFEEEDELKRVNVNSLIENGKTIISIALPYKFETYQDYSKPYFSKYTLGEDYHNILKIKLKMLEKYIFDNYNGNCVSLCDTGVLSDKETARKSGIGFQGKNTNIITKSHGSFVFLGEIITTLDLELSLEEKSHCGSCKICIDACPVNAISEEGIDSKRCLSFVTQKKDDLTIEEINLMGTRVFGCDTCQDVCPYNKNKATSNIKEFEPKEYLINIDLEEILFMSNKEFKNKYGKHALSWRGKYIIQRNLIIAAGNSKNKDYIGILEKKTDDLRLKRYTDISLKKLKGF